MPTKRKTGDLVALMFTQETPYVAVRLASRVLDPMGLNLDRTDWSHDFGERCILHYPLGKARPLDVPEAPMHGIIGVYDRTDYSHVEQMVADALAISHLMASKNALALT